MADLNGISDLLSRSLSAPQGPEDAAFHTGVIKSWDRQTGINVVTINAVDISNVRALQTGIANWFTAGDVVIIMRKQTQYFILGKVAAPGGAAGSGVQYASSNIGVQMNTGGVFADLTGFPNTPQVSVYIGSSKSALVIWSCEVTVSSGSPVWSANTFNAYVEGEVGWAITGATTIPAGSFNSTTVKHGAQFPNPAAGQAIDSKLVVTGTYTVSSGIGVNVGLNTFSMKYRTIAGLSVFFGNPSITVIPF